MAYTPLEQNTIDLTTLKGQIENLPVAETPTISVNSSTGLITASANGKSATSQLSTQAAKTVTPSTSSQTAVAAGKYTTGDVTVAAIQTETKTATPSTSSQDITPSSGKYLTKVTVNAMPTMTLPTTTSTTGSGTTKATVGRSTSDQYINIPTGYNSAAANYKISAVANGALSAGSGSANATGTNITLGTATTTKPSSGSYITATGSGTASVGTSGYLESGTSKESNTATKYYPITSQGATTYNTSTSDQTISSGRWLTGAQTIKAVTTSNISAANIKAGVNVKVGDANSAGRIANVTGTFTSDADATAADLANGKTAYVNGNKITGTGTMASGDVTCVNYSASGAALAYLNGKATVGTSSGKTILTSLAGSMQEIEGKNVLVLADAC